MSVAEMREVGRVTWGELDVNRAVLFADGRWRVTSGDVERPETAANLAIHYDGWDRHPSLYYGQGILPDLADLMGGTHVFHQPPHDPSVDH